jgi:hypothetical protein
VATYYLVPPFGKAKLYGLSSRAIAKAGCAVGKESLRDTAVDFCLQYHGAAETSVI